MGCYFLWHTCIFLISEKNNKIRKLSAYDEMFLWSRTPVSCFSHHRFDIDFIFIANLYKYQFFKILLECIALSIESLLMKHELCLIIEYWPSHSVQFSKTEQKETRCYSIYPTYFPFTVNFFFYGFFCRFDVCMIAKINMFDCIHIKNKYMVFTIKFCNQSGLAFLNYEIWYFQLTK